MPSWAGRALLGRRWLTQEPGALNWGAFFYFYIFYFNFLQKYIFDLEIYRSILGHPAAGLPGSGRPAAGRQGLERKKIRKKIADRSLGPVARQRGGRPPLAARQLGGRPPATLYKVFAPSPPFGLLKI